MSDVNVLYLVTAVVVAALLVWAGVVLFTCEDAPDESPPPPSDDKPTDRELRRVSFDKPPKIVTPSTQPPPLDHTPPPVEVSAPSERSVAIAGKSAPVVLLPVMRSRLDSHSEIVDEKSGAGGEDDTRDSTFPPSGPPLVLTAAIGRSDPTSGPTERSAIVDRQRLFLLADGSGQRVQNELVSAVLVDAAAKAFEADHDASIARDPALHRRADRLRRSVLGAYAALRERGKDTTLDVDRAYVLAAHFSPDNRTLHVATTGPDRAYRLRGSEILQLNKKSLAAGESAAAVDIGSFETEVGDVYVFGSDAAFLALGDELRAVLKFDPSIDRVAAHFVAAAAREGKTAGMTAIVVRVDLPRPSQLPPAM
jgi:serine/threonine protein phosphatase PrpC